MPLLCKPNCLRTALYLVAIQTARDKAQEASDTIFCRTYTMVPYTSCHGTLDCTSFPSLVTCETLEHYNKFQNSHLIRPLKMTSNLESIKFLFHWTKWDEC